jgi:hypothetical protein
MRTDIREAIDAYAKDRDPLGDFLTAVMENNLKEAFQTADDDNLRDLQEIVTYVYQHVPVGAWGNPARVAAWLAGPEVAPYVPATEDLVEVTCGHPDFIGMTGRVERSFYEPMGKILVRFPARRVGHFLPSQLKKVN